MKIKIPAKTIMVCDFCNAKSTDADKPFYYQYAVTSTIYGDQGTATTELDLCRNCGDKLTKYLEEQRTK